MTDEKILEAARLIERNKELDRLESALAKGIANGNVQVSVFAGTVRVERFTRRELIELRDAVCCMIEGNGQKITHLKPAQLESTVGRKAGEGWQPEEGW